MAQVGYLEIPPELVSQFQRLLSSTSSRRTGAVRKSGYLPSREQVVRLTNRSLLPEISARWAALTEVEKQNWTAAAAVCGMRGWSLFVQDTAYRIKYGLQGNAVPSLLHQYKVGRLVIAAPANRALLAQYHPERYFVSKKMRGNTTQRVDVPINETLRLPLEVGLSYRAQLVPTGADPIARFYAIVYSSYQGRTIETEHGFDLLQTTGWTSYSSLLNDVIGIPRYYDLWLEFDRVRGWFEWDNVRALHTATNWARDAKCNDVNNELTTLNFQLEKSWEEQFLPNGAGFDSVYPAD